MPRLRLSDEVRNSSPSEGPYALRELPGDIVLAIEDLRAQLLTQSSHVSYEVANVNGMTMNSLFTAAGQKPRIGKLLSFRSSVEAAITQYITDAANARFVIRPHELHAGLKQIAAAASRLAELLTELKHAQDAMVRVRRPQHFSPDPIFVGPCAPVEFAVWALEVADTALAATRMDRSSIPYVQPGSDRYALNRLIAALIVAWDDCFRTPATFTGEPNPSAFVKLLGSCLQRVGFVPQSYGALAKSCARTASTMVRSHEAARNVQRHRRWMR